MDLLILERKAKGWGKDAMAEMVGDEENHR